MRLLHYPSRAPTFAPGQNLYQECGEEHACGDRRQHHKHINHKPAKWRKLAHQWSDVKPSKAGALGKGGDIAWTGGESGERRDEPRRPCRHHAALETPFPLSAAVRRAP